MSMRSFFSIIEVRNDSDKWETVDTEKIEKVSSDELGLFFDYNFSPEFDFPDVIDESFYFYPVDCTQKSDDFIADVVSRNRHSLPEMRKMCTLTLNDVLSINFDVYTNKKHLKHYVTNDEYSDFKIYHREEYLFSFSHNEIEKLENGEWVEYSGDNMFIEDRLEHIDIDPSDIFLARIRACDIMYQTQQLFDTMSDVAFREEISPSNVRCILFLP